MKFIALATLILTATAVAAPSPQSKITGYQTLIAIGNARGIKPPLTLTSLQALKTNPAAYREVNTKLRVSPTVFNTLMTFGNQLAPTLMVTQAVLESASNQSLFESAVAQLISSNPQLAAINADTLNALLRSPDLLAAANRAAEAAAKAVTPTGSK